MMKLLPFLALGLLAQARAAEDDRLEFASPETSATLVELYTSEGCSSCPPADRWLSRFTQDKTLWRQVVPVAFHVDYWDRLGWKDRFSSADATERQRTFAALTKSDSVYTPCVVAGGREQKQWSQGLTLAKPVLVGSLRLVILRDSKAMSVFFNPALGIDSDALELHFVWLGFGLESKVSRGENAGSKLLHDFVVLAHHSEAFKNKRARLTLAPPDAPKLGVAVWLENPKTRLPVQATGGYMP